MPSIARLPMKVLPSRNPASFPKNASITTSNYRTYAEGTSVATFSKEDIKQNAKLLADVQRKLTVSRREIGGLQKEPMLRSVLAAGEERDMTLPVRVLFAVWT